MLPYGQGSAKQRATNGLKLLFGNVDSFAQVQEFWRFLTNESVTIERIKQGLALIVYKMLKEGINKNYIVNNAFGLGMVAEEKNQYKK